MLNCKKHEIHSSTKKSKRVFASNKPCSYPSFTEVSCPNILVKQIVLLARENIIPESVVLGECGHVAAVSKFETGICSPLKKLLPVKPLLPLSLKFCNRVRHGKNNQYDRYFFWLCNFSDPVDKKWVRIKQPKALM